MTTTEKLKKLKETSDDPRIKNSKLTGGKIYESFLEKIYEDIRIYNRIIKLEKIMLNKW